jgi:hypothetical protein
MMKPCQLSTPMTDEGVNSREQMRMASLPQPWLVRYRRTLAEKQAQHQAELEAWFPLGWWVIFESPLFGPSAGRIKNRTETALIVDAHFITSEECTIPIGWCQHAVRTEVEARNYLIPGGY